MTKNQIPFMEVLEQADDIIIVTEADQVSLPGPKIVYVNKAFEKISGYTKQEALGQTPRILQGPNTDPSTLDDIHQALARKQPIHCRILNYSKSGDEYWLDLNIVPLFNERNEATHFAAFERDITQEVHLKEKLYYLAEHDSLTNIFNRRVFFNQLNTELIRYQRYEQPFSIILYDLDNFKAINDEYGHQTGDALLKGVTKRVSEMLRKSDVHGRYGGEEFTILLVNTTATQALNIAEKICWKIAEKPFNCEGEIIHMTASFGISCIQKRDTKLEALISRADKAMYAAKKAGKNRVFCLPDPNNKTT